jgi:hypothetical protein
MEEKKCLQPYLLGTNVMPRKPENIFIDGIHKYLPSENLLYREKTANPYRGGTPDWYYDGRFSDLWIEYKYHAGHFPKKLELCNYKARTCLTKLQHRWVNRRWDNGFNAIVMFGCKNGVLILTNKGWENIFTREETTANLVTRKEAAEWIVKFTLSPTGRQLISQAA